MRTTFFLLCFFCASVGFLQQISVGADVVKLEDHSTKSSKIVTISPLATSGKNEVKTIAQQIPNSSKLEAKELKIEKRAIDKEVKDSKDKIGVTDGSSQNEENKNDEKENVVVYGNNLHPKEKRHFSSLLKFRNSPFYYQSFSPREDDFNTVEGQEGEDGKEIRKRFIGSILRSQNVPQTFIAYPHKKHFSSVLRSRSFSPLYVKRLSELAPMDDTLEDYANSVYLLSDPDDPIVNRVEKRHIGSLGGLRYSFTRGNPYGNHMKRFYASLLKSSRFIPDQNIEKRYFDESKYSKGLPVYDSLPIDYGEMLEYDVEDLDPQQAMQEEDYLASKDKRHFSSIIDKRHISSLMRSRNLYKRQISESDYKPLGNVTNTPLNSDKDLKVLHYVLPTTVATNLIDVPGLKSKIFKRNIQSTKALSKNVGTTETLSSLQSNQGNKDQYPSSHLENSSSDSEKRHFSSALQNKEPIDKRYFSSLLQNKDPNDKRHFSSLLQNIEPIDKRHFSSLLSNKEPLEKRHFSSLLRNDDMGKRFYASLLDDTERDLDKRHFSSLLQNKNQMSKKGYLDSYLGSAEDAYDKRQISSLLQDKEPLDKRHLSSLLQNMNSLDKRHFSSLLQNKDPLNKRHFSSLLQSKNIDEGKRYFTLPFDNGEDYDKRHYSSLLQNVEPTDKRHFSSLLMNKEPLDKRHLSSLLQNKYATEKREFDTFLDDEDNFDKRHFSSLLQNKGH